MLRKMALDSGSSLLQLPLEEPLVVGGDRLARGRLRLVRTGVHAAQFQLVAEL